jgi:poly(A) polymerase
MQPRMMKINRKNAKFLLTQRAFRAAYDFMIIRAKNGEVEENIAKFWTNIQLDLTVNTKEKKHQKLI